MRLSGFELFPSTATRERLGTTSLSSSRRFSSSSTLSAMKPVMLGREGGGCSPGHDQVHGQRNQFCGKVGVAFLTALRETIFDDQVLTLDVTEFSQPVPKALDWPQLQIGHQPDALHPHRLLSARRHRPRHRRTANERDKLATPQVEHATPPSDGPAAGSACNRRGRPVLGADLNCSESVWASPWPAPRG